jgi:glycosyltransferase involved in cell wall biosynthesis
MSIKLSIIIPSFQRSAGLRRLLESIWEQQPWVKQSEVIIVDNAQEVQVEYVQIQDVFSEKGMRVRLIHEPVPGVGMARNAGIKAAGGDFIGFLDDDEELPDGYLELLFGLLAHTDGKSIFGGPYRSVLETPTLPWIKADYYKSDHGDFSVNLTGGKYLFGGNLIVPKGVFDRIGVFSIKIGHSGSKIDYGEDTDFLIRAEKDGLTQVYEPKLFIWHHISIHRQNLEWFIHQKRRSSFQKAFLFVIHHQDLADPKKIVLNRLHFLRKTIFAFFDLLVGWLGIVIRDRGLYPDYQNYYVEKILPAYGAMLYAWNIFRLIRTDNSFTE